MGKQSERQSKRDATSAKVLVFDDSYPAWQGLPNVLELHFDAADMPRFVTVGYYLSPERAEYQCYPLGERTEVQRSWIETKGGRALQLELSHKALFLYDGYARGVQHAA